MAQLRTSVPPDEPLARVCRVAEERALELGHVLLAWAAEGDVGRRSVCGKCGRVAYARAEGGLSGIAGPALTEACDS